MRLGHAAWHRSIGEGVGRGVGDGVGARVGFGVGIGVGSAVGSNVGARVGAGVGRGVGCGVGIGVGCGVGQANKLHGIVSVVFPHSSPPCCAAVTTARSRVFVPPAQLAVHDAHSSQSPSTHSTGQGCGLQGATSSTSVSSTAHVPPYLAGTMVRFRTINPPPHSWVHSEYALQLETSQSCGA